MVATLTALQFCFAITWVMYVIYLPALAAQAGIDKSWVPWILMMDQAIFAACDWAAGMYADRVGRVVGRIGDRMAAVTLASCAAFVALPWAAPALGSVAFVVLTAFWSVTSSALRAPPLALVSRHVPEHAHPRMAGLYLLGLGIAGAIAPYLGLSLKGVDPRIPFAAASVAVAVFALGIARAERARQAPAPATAPAGEGPMAIAPTLAFALAALLFAFGFQVHTAINSTPAYLRVATPEHLPQLLPVFWVGFSLAILPATLLPKRFGGVRVMVAAGVIGVLAAWFTALSLTFEPLIAAQLAMGAAWGVLLESAFAAALATGRGGREGGATGVILSVLAVAAFARIALVTAGIQKQPGVAEWLPLAPALAWGLGAALLLMRLRS